MTDEPKTPNLVSIGDARPKSDIQKAGDDLRKNMEAHCANVTLVAQLRRASYLAYIREGFSAEEALTLCCK